MFLVKFITNSSSSFQLYSKILSTYLQTIYFHRKFEKKNLFSNRVKQFNKRTTTPTRKNQYIYLLSASTLSGFKWSFLYHLQSSRLLHFSFGLTVNLVFIDLLELCHLVYAFMCLSFSSVASSLPICLLAILSVLSNL